MISSDPYSEFESAEDFSVLIAWSGPEDKPYLRAMLLSDSRAHLAEDRPFWVYAVISRDEFLGLVRGWQARRLLFHDGPYVGSETGYYLEVSGVDSTYHSFLGYEGRAVEALEQIADTLEGANQQPVRDVLIRLTGLEEN